MPDITSTTEEKVPVFISPKTPAGHPAKIDGVAVLTMVAGNATTSAATAQEIADSDAAGKPGLVGYLISEDVPGVSTWQISADADLGAGVKTIVDGGSYTYNDPQAAALGTGVGTPILK